MKKISLDDIRKKHNSNAPASHPSPLLDFADITIPPHDMDLPSAITDRMFEHQKIAVGGILGDDMGLGKTFQVLSLLCGLFRTASGSSTRGSVSKVLVICPVSVISSWCREVTDHVKPHVQRFILDVITSDLSKKKRETLLREIFLSSKFRLVVTSYQLFANMVDSFTLDTWDYVILDEGHIIKNPSTKLSKAVHQLQTRHRLLLTGTPIQNNLTELWSLVSWVTDGQLLGTRNYFNAHFVEPITKGQDPKAHEVNVLRSQKCAAALHNMLRPILLQRKKTQFSDVLQLKNKLDLIMWIPLSSRQRSIYTSYLEDKNVQLTLERKHYPVEAINYLKTLCRHPLLIEAAHKTKMGNNKNSSLDVDALASSIGAMAINSTTTRNEFYSQSQDDDVYQDSGLHSVFDIVQKYPSVDELLELIRILRADDHKTLVFSQSKLMLDIIQHILAQNGIASHRIDGSVTGRERQRIIDEVNNPSNAVDVCLLTTKACGVGITLTGADRVIIFDPSWNPAEDRQAVDRAYRIGQENDVVIYRMIMAGTVEEKIYEKQVFKDGLRVVSERGTNTSERYFSDEETRKLFELGPADRCVVMEKMWSHGCSVSTSSLPHAIANMKSIHGFSQHHILYNENQAQGKPNVIVSSTAAANSRTSAASPSDIFIRKASGAADKPVLVDLVSDDESTSDANLKPSIPDDDTAAASDCGGNISRSSSEDNLVDSDDDNAAAATHTKLIRLSKPLLSSTTAATGTLATSVKCDSHSDHDSDCLVDSDAESSSSPKHVEGRRFMKKYAGDGVKLLDSAMPEDFTAAASDCGGNISRSSSDYNLVDSDDDNAAAATHTKLIRLSKPLLSSTIAVTSTLATSVKCDSHSDHDSDCLVDSDAESSSSPKHVEGRRFIKKYAASSRHSSASGADDGMNLLDSAIPEDDTAAASDCGGNISRSNSDDNLVDSDDDNAAAVTHTKLIRLSKPLLSSTNTVTSTLATSAKCDSHSDHDSDCLVDSDAESSSSPKHVEGRRFIKKYAGAASARHSSASSADDTEQCYAYDVSGNIANDGMNLLDSAITEDDTASASDCGGNISRSNSDDNLVDSDDDHAAAATHTKLIRLSKPLLSSTNAGTSTLATSAKCDSHSDHDSDCLVDSDAESSSSPKHVEGRRFIKKYAGAASSRHSAASITTVCEGSAYCDLPSSSAVQYYADDNASLSDAFSRDTVCFDSAPLSPSTCMPARNDPEDAFRRETLLLCSPTASEDSGVNSAPVSTVLPGGAAGNRETRRATLILPSSPSLTASSPVSIYSNEGCETPTQYMSDIIDISADIFTQNTPRRDTLLLPSPTSDENVVSSRPTPVMPADTPMDKFARRETLILPSSPSLTASSPLSIYTNETNDTPTQYISDVIDITNVTERRETLLLPEDDTPTQYIYDIDANDENDASCIQAMSQENVKYDNDPTACRRATLLLQENEDSTTASPASTASSNHHPRRSTLILSPTGGSSSNNTTATPPSSSNISYNSPSDDLNFDLSYLCIGSGSKGSPMVKPSSPEQGSSLGGYIIESSVAVSTPAAKDEYESDELVDSDTEEIVERKSIMKRLHRVSKSTAAPMQVPFLLYHEDALQPYDIITKPAADLKKHSIRLYNKHITSAQRYELDGDINAAIKEYIAALSICDEDRILHEKLHSFGKSMGVF